jgi:CSLREA domain-containing protein
MKTINMKNQKKSFLTYFVMTFALVLTTISTAQAGGFTVNSVLDHKDINPGDGKCAATINTCTLRAAIEEANTQPGVNHQIIFNSLFEAPNRPKTIVLTNGPLNIKSNVAIFGPGARQLMIDGDHKSTVFLISKNTHGGINDLTIQNGYSHAPFVSVLGAGVTNYGGYGLHRVTVRNNIAINDTDPSQAEYGGGIRNYGEMYLYFSTVTGNKAGLGGGIYNTGVIRIWNSTISGNSSFYAGGGIYHKDGELWSTGATIANNLSQMQPGGGIWNGLDFPLHLSNTIVADNISPYNKDLHGSFNSDGNNLIENRGGSTGYVAADLPDGTNPMLDVLQNNGGHTDTHALLLGSPAINAGNDCPSINLDACSSGYDQRTYPFARKIGTVDIGAFEFQEESSQFVQISGKVLKPNGRGLNNAIVTLTGDGEALSVETDSHGNFSFDQVMSGKSYVISAESRQYNYAAQTLFVTEARDDVNFVPVQDRTR